MVRTTPITLLAAAALAGGGALAGGVALAAPGPAAAARAQSTAPVASPTNPDGTSGPPVNTVAPAIEWWSAYPSASRVALGTRLHCTEGTWADDPTSFVVRWRRGARLVHTGATYRVVRADAGSTLRCYVRAVNAQGTGFASAGPVQVAGHPPRPERHTTTRHTPKR